MAIQTIQGDILSAPLNNNFSDLSSRINQINAGPVGTYNSLSELNSAYPNGAKGYTIVNEQNDEGDLVGYMYTWDGAQWVKGSIFKAEGLADGAATSPKRTELGESASVVGTGRPVCDLDNLTITYSPGSVRNFIVYRGTSYEIPTDTVVTFPSGTTGTLWKLVFNTDTKSIVFYTHSQRAPENCLRLGVVKADPNNANVYRVAELNGDYIYVNDNSKVNTPVMIFANRAPDFNFIERKVTIYNNTFFFANNSYFGQQGLVEIDFPETASTFFVKYDFIARTYKTETFRSAQRTNEGIIAVVSDVYNSVSMQTDYTINGIDPRNTNIQLVKPAKIKTISRTIEIPEQSIFVGKKKMLINATSLTWYRSVNAGTTLSVYYDIFDNSFYLINDVEQAPFQGRTCVLSFELGNELKGQGNFVVDSGSPESLAILSNSLEDCAASWWVSPLAAAYKNVYDKKYLSYTDSNGYSGVISIDADGRIVKKRLKKRDVDDHNAVAVDVMPDGKIISAYSTGHNIDKLIRVRISTRKEIIDDFEDEILIEASDYTCYSQMFYVNQKWFIFFRVGNSRWAFTTSANGREWSTPVNLVVAPNQYYIKFQKMSDNNNLKMAMYSNPNAGDTSIRVGVFNTETYNLELVSGAVLGNTDVSNESFPIIITPASGKRNRLLDVAVTNKDNTSIVYAEFSNMSDGIYKVYENSTITDLSPTGAAFYAPSVYVNGAVFKDPSTVILSEGLEGRDYIRKFTKNGTAWAKASDLYNDRFAIRPTVLNDEIIVQSGYYDQRSYTTFQTYFKIISAN